MKYSFMVQYVDVLEVEADSDFEAALTAVEKANEGAFRIDCIGFDGMFDMEAPDKEAIAQIDAQMGRIKRIDTLTEFAMIHGTWENTKRKKKVV